MISIAKNEIMLLLNSKVFFFNEEGYYTSMPVKEAKKKGFKNLYFDRNERTFSYEEPHLLLSEDYLNLCNTISRDLISKAISRAILRLSEGETENELVKYSLHYLNLINLIFQRTFFVQDLKNIAVRKKSNKYIFFNNDGFIETLNEKEILKSDVINIGVNFYGNIYFHNKTLKPFLNEFTNETILRMAYAKLKDGDTLEDLKRYYHSVILGKKEPLKELDYFVTKICQPMFIKEPENPDPNTFDYIHIDVNLAITWKSDKKDYFIQHQPEINNMVVKKLQSNKQFQKYNIPINYLKISKITLMNQRRTIQYVFELKNK